MTIPRCTKGVAAMVGIALTLNTSTAFGQLAYQSPSGPAETQVELYPVSACGEVEPTGTQNSSWCWFQQESRTATTISNVLKAKQDMLLNSIDNAR
jgi:hypothetical protein